MTRCSSRHVLVFLTIVVVVNHVHLKFVPLNLNKSKQTKRICGIIDP